MVYGVLFVFFLSRWRVLCCLNVSVCVECDLTCNVYGLFLCFVVCVVCVLVRFVCDLLCDAVWTVVCVCLM